MIMNPFYREEDLFPREFTHVKERPWGRFFAMRTIRIPMTATTR